MMTLGGNTRTTLKQGFWPQSCLTVVESNAIFFSNEDVREKFTMDEHYVGPACNRPASLFCVGIHCDEGYMVLVRTGDEEHFKPIWLVKALSLPNFVRTSYNFRQMKVEYCRPSTKEQNAFCTYLDWDTKKNFKWIVDSAYKPIWINMDTIVCAWKPLNGSKLETMTIPQKHKIFAKDNLTHIAATKNDAEIGYEAEDRDGET
jgi:hypothetical protein